MFDKLETTFEVKELNDEGVISGLAAAMTLDRGGDIIEPEAIKSAVKSINETGHMPKMLWQHNPSDVIGVWSEVKQTSDGLFMKGKILLDIPLGKQTHTLLTHKAVDGLSIGYRTKDSEYSGKTRRIKDLEIWETSVVTFPMNPDARITDVKQITDIREVERILRDAGVANKFAKLIAKHGFDQAIGMLDTKKRDVSQDEQGAIKRLQLNLASLKETIHANDA